MQEAAEFLLSFFTKWRTWIFVLSISVAIGLLNIYLGGKFEATFALLVGTVVVCVSFLSPRASLYTLLFVGLAVEEGKLPYSWTRDIPYHYNLNNAFAGLQGLPMTPLELHLLCLIASLAVRSVIFREKWVPIVASKPLLAYFLGLVFFVSLGLMNNGVPLVALWEVRGIAYLFVLAVLIPQIIRTREQLTYAVWAMILAICFRALEVSFHFWQANFSVAQSAGFGSHDDAGFFAVMIAFGAAMWALRVGDTKQRGVLTSATVLFFLAMIGADRRTAYPILVTSLLLIPLMMPREIQRKLVKLSWKLGIVFILYLAVFWNSNSDHIFVSPVRSLREGIAWDDESAAGESYGSNLYRKVENYALFRMFALRPLLGTGYGVPIEYATPIPVQWYLGFYIPHNQVLGVTVKGGLVGFLLFINFYLSMISAATVLFWKLKSDRYLQSVLVLVLAAIVGHLIFASFDLVLCWYRPNVLIGALFGITSTISILQKSMNESDGSEAEPPEKGNFNHPAQWLLGTRGQTQSPA